MSKIVVTGGGGFVGSHVVDRLCAAGHHVLVVDDFSTGDRNNLAAAEAAHPGALTVLEADVTDPATADAVAGFRPEAVLLLAAQFSVKVSMRDPLLDARVNVVGLVNMLEAARRGGSRKVVFASSGGTIYGQADQGRPLTEATARVPESFYGLTKSVAVDYLRLYHAVHGLDHVALALGNVYGPRQTPFGEAGVVAIFTQRMLDGQPCVINGDGLTTRDYVHVSDVADAFVRAVDHGHGLINVSTGREHSVLEIHAGCALQVGSALPPEFGPPLAGEVRRVCLDNTRAREQLGWEPRVRLPEGIGTVVDSLRRETERRNQPSGVGAAQ